MDKLRETKFSIATHKSRELGPQTPIGDPPSGEVSVHDPDLAPPLVQNASWVLSGLEGKKKKTLFVAKRA